MATAAEHDQARRAHYLNLLAHRTDSDGKPRPGFKANVALLKREIAKIDAGKAPSDEA